MTRREKMMAAIAAGKSQPKTVASDAALVTPVTPRPPKAEKPDRSAAGRDARALGRGRLPDGTHVRAEWTGEVWIGILSVWAPAPEQIDPNVDHSGLTEEEFDDRFVPRVLKRFMHKSDGQFRLMEELDVMFWEWMAAAGEEDLKARLAFTRKGGAK